jgi:nitroimidazol reductase NimA-like FMN-containing flavoprotein (pyridoxamine 5'-phosphate oxidase superfamily)
MRTLTSMTLDDNGLEVLDAATCRALLGTIRLGRVALSSRALPIIVPVAYTYVGDEILMAAASTLVRRAAHAGDVICFEADAHDDDGALWSVLVTGRLAILARPQAAGGWTDPAVSELVSLQTALVSGRRTTMPVGDRTPSGPEIERSRR